MSRLGWTACFEQPNPSSPRTQLQIPLTLLSCTERAAINYWMYYGCHLLPSHPCEDLELAKACRVYERKRTGKRSWKPPIITSQQEGQGLHNPAHLPALQLPAVLLLPAHGPCCMLSLIFPLNELLNVYIYLYIYFARRSSEVKSPHSSGMASSALLFVSLFTPLAWGLQNYICEAQRC